jgi:SAM-dependent methyltransferase
MDVLDAQFIPDMIFGTGSTRRPLFCRDRRGDVLLSSWSMWRCPGCGGGDAHQTHRLSVADAALYFVRPWVDRARHSELVDCITTLWGADEARLVRCGDCGLRSADPFVAGNANFYGLAYGRDSAHPYLAWRWEYQLTEALVTSTTGTVLEIGAGDGAFQRSIIVAGVDPSRLFATEFSAGGRRALGGLGVSVTDVDFRELPAANHAVVCGHQVFEHLDDLDAAFDAFDRLTSPDGVVAVSVPNGLNTERFEAAGGELDMPPNHVSTWGLTAFSAAAGRRGWKVADFREEPVSRVSAAKTLAKAWTFRARERQTSFPALVERRSPSAGVRYGLMAASAVARLPLAYVASSVRYGGAIWVAMRRR